MYSLLLAFFSIFSQSFSGSFSKNEDVLALPDTNRIHVPIGGNSWIQNGKTEKISETGLSDWTNTESILQTYVRFAKIGKINLSLKASCETGKSKIRILVAGKSREIELLGIEKIYDLGSWEINQTGYLKLSVQGISKSGKEFGKLNEWILGGNAIDEKAAFVKDNAGNFFYWGRRGPSVHLNYPIPTDENVEWFYNEVTVPEKQDVIGSYFMANGFGEGYFGMQVNSAKERRILFSVWSPFQTDDPKSIPKDKQIVMLKKGIDVYTGEFGNEGSGGQSYLKYNWKAGITYKFLLQGKPSGDSTTTYTAYFFTPEKAEWKLIASFKRPKTQTYLKKLHSFLENFIPETGNQTRKVYFGKQWIRTASGTWTELNQAKFSADATARKGYRLDYAGGKEKNYFYLKNCGFFNEFTMIGDSFTRESSGEAPKINFEKLP
ncbi:DUF3472 domain-containing protein [Dyadobacter subterraneus]|uniref:DUF3472 domain-containing protein n=1 Tax=Dyadobacter subterraneus TaxID=2773304 RepID=A0ABR9WL32_9BACT|nr:DUF3472 domain-containing protein [Dyadobacter subterraneus]MBE9466205.1 DUF3472 domain-containing protein [Dyadobacter subterraneus]